MQQLKSKLIDLVVIRKLIYRSGLMFLRC